MKHNDKFLYGTKERCKKTVALKAVLRVISSVKTKAGPFKFFSMVRVLVSTIFLGDAFSYWKGFIFSCLLIVTQISWT